SIRETVSFISSLEPIQTATLIAANHGSCMSLLRRQRYLFVLGAIYDVILVVDGQDLLAVQPNLHKRLVSLRQPESTNLLVLPHEVGSLDPEGKLPGGMAFDPDHRVVVNINPKFAFKQVLVFSFRRRLQDKTAVGSHLLFAQQSSAVVVRGDGAVVMLLAGGGFDFTADERVQGEVSDQSRPLFGCDDKSFF